MRWERRATLLRSNFGVLALRACRPTSARSRAEGKARGTEVGEKENRERRREGGKTRAREQGWLPFPSGPHGCAAGRRRVRVSLGVFL